MSETIAMSAQPAIHAPGRLFQANTTTAGPSRRRTVVSVTGTQLKRLFGAGTELALTSLLYRTPSAPLRLESCRDGAAGIRSPCVAPRSTGPRARGKPEVRC